MLVLRTQRVMFGCPAGNIDGGYGNKLRQKYAKVPARVNNTKVTPRNRYKK